MEVAIVSFLMPCPAAQGAIYWASSLYTTRSLVEPKLNFHGIYTLSGAESIQSTIVSEAEAYCGGQCIGVYADIIPQAAMIVGTFALTYHDGSHPKYTLWHVDTEQRRGWIYTTSTSVLRNLGYFIAVSARDHASNMSFYDMKKEVIDLRSRIETYQTLDRQIMRAWYESRWHQDTSPSSSVLGSNNNFG